jgi:hypothetical protein
MKLHQRCASNPPRTPKAPTTAAQHTVASKGGVHEGVRVTTTTGEASRGGAHRWHVRQRYIPPSQQQSAYRMPVRRRAEGRGRSTTHPAALTLRRIPHGSIQAEGGLLHSARDTASGFHSVTSLTRVSVRPRIHHQPTTQRDLLRITTPAPIGRKEDP